MGKGETFRTFLLSFQCSFEQSHLHSRKQVPPTQLTRRNLLDLDVVKSRDEDKIYVDLDDLLKMGRPERVEPSTATDRTPTPVPPSDRYTHVCGMAHTSGVDHSQHLELLWGSATGNWFYTRTSNQSNVNKPEKYLRIIKGSCGQQLYIRKLLSFRPQ